MKTYELIVKKDKQYGLDKSLYVMGRIVGILEGSGAGVMYNTFQMNVKYPMRISFMADKDQIDRIKTAITKSYSYMVDIVKY